MKHSTRPPKRVEEYKLSRRQKVFLRAYGYSSSDPVKTHEALLVFFATASFFIAWFFLLLNH